MVDERPIRTEGKMSELDQFRAEKDRLFKLSRQSPLTPDQKKEFQGLNYFPENPDLRFELPIEKFDHPEKIEMQTSTGDIQTYQRFGRIHFAVQGQQAELSQRPRCTT